MELPDISDQACNRIRAYVKLEYESGIRWKDDDPRLLEAWEELTENLKVMGEQLTVPEVSELVVQMAAMRNGGSTGNGNSS